MSPRAVVTQRASPERAWMTFPAPPRPQSPGQRRPGRRWFPWGRRQSPRGHCHSPRGRPLPTSGLVAHGAKFSGLVARRHASSGLVAAGRRFIRPRGTQVRYCFWPCGTQGLLRGCVFIVVWIPDVYDAQNPHNLGGRGYGAGRVTMITSVIGGYVGLAVGGRAVAPSPSPCSARSGGRWG